MRILIKYFSNPLNVMILVGLNIFTWIVWYISTKRYKKNSKLAAQYEGKKTDICLLLLATKALQYSPIIIVLIVSMNAPQARSANAIEVFMSGLFYIYLPVYIELNSIYLANFEKSDALFQFIKGAYYLLSIMVNIFAIYFNAHITSIMISGLPIALAIFKSSDLFRKSYEITKRKQPTQ